MKPYIIFAALATSAASSAYAIPVGSGWDSIQIGTNTGSTTYNPTTQVYSMASKGGDIASTTDSFQFLYKSIGDNQQLIAKISNFPNNVDWAKVGVMIRQDTSPGSANSFFLMRPRFGSAGQYRTTAGGSTQTTWEETPARNDSLKTTPTNNYRARYLHPVNGKYLSVIRQGSVVTTYSSDDGKCWNLRTQSTPALSGNVLAGIALASNNSTTQVSADVSQLQTRPVPPDINFECERAQRDGPLAPPTSWVTPNNNTWSITTTNPDSAAELRTCMAGDDPSLRVKGVDSPRCPIDLSSFYPAHAYAGGPGIAGCPEGSPNCTPTTPGFSGCTGQQNCSPSTSSDSTFGGFKGIDVNDQTGYRWANVDGGTGGSSKLVLKLGSSNTTMRTMQLWINGVNKATLSSSNPTRSLGGEVFSVTVDLVAGKNNTVELRDPSNQPSNNEFDVFSLRVMSAKPGAQPAWMLSGYSGGTWTQASVAADNIVRVGDGNAGITAADFWMRTEVNLTQQQKEDLMFYGRWNNAASIYVNGILATTLWNTDKHGTMHYIGLNDSARSALKVGTNVIAVRISCLNNNGFQTSTNCNGYRAYTEIGLGLNSALAHLPDQDTLQKVDNVKSPRANLIKQLAKERGIIGGTYANYYQGTLISNVWFGYQDRTLSSSMPSKPIMRLASVDKRVTDAVTIWMYKNTKFKPEDSVFLPTALSAQPLLNVQPSGGTWGTNVDQITVESLRAHTSGLTPEALNTQGRQDKLAFDFTANYPTGITASEITGNHLARFFASQPSCWFRFSATSDDAANDCSKTPGGINTLPTYSSNGMALLRYVQEKAYAGTYNAILDAMQAPEIRVAYERYSSNPANSPRPQNEPGYMLIGRETHARWAELEEYRALSASAAGLVDFFNRYGAEWTRNGTTGLSFSVKAGGQSGAMDGTLSYGGSDPLDCASGSTWTWGQRNACGTGEAAIWNSDMDGGTDQRYGNMQTYTFNGVQYWGTCNPTSNNSLPFRLALGSNYLSINSANQMVVNTDTSGKWSISVADAANGYYYIKNSDSNDTATPYLQSDAAGTSVVKGSGTSNLAKWKFVKVSDTWAIQNVQYPAKYLNLSGSSVVLGAQGLWTTCI